MAKKNFKSGLDDFFKENLDEIKSITNQDQKENIKKDEVENVDEQKIKWLFLKLKRYEEELQLWRTGKLTVEKFQKTLKEQGILYDSEKNKFIEDK